jgi:hypothetical protein
MAQSHFSCFTIGNGKIPINQVLAMAGRPCAAYVMPALVKDTAVELKGLLFECTQIDNGRRELRVVVCRDRAATSRRRARFKPQQVFATWPNSRTETELAAICVPASSQKV